MKIEILNSSSLIVTLSWQSCVGWLSVIWSNLVVHVVCYVIEACLLYTSDAADEEDSVDLGGRRIIKKSAVAVVK